MATSVLSCAHAVGKENEIGELEVQIRCQMLLSVLNGGQIEERFAPFWIASWVPSCGHRPLLERSREFHWPERKRWTLSRPASK